MSILFTNCVILLDSTFYKKKFSKELRDSLTGQSINVSGAFHAELEQNLEIIPQSKADIYHSNIDFLQEQTEIRNIITPNGMNNDIWNLICILSEKNKNVVLITANNLLIEKTVLSGLKINIFDLNDEKYYAFTGFPALKEKFELHQNETEVLRGDYKLNTGSILYGDSNSVVTIGESIYSGGEAELYELNNTPGYIAKIFHNGRFPVQKLNVVSNMAKVSGELDIDWALLPIEVLYYDKEKRFPAGFIEKKGQSGLTLYDNPLFMGDLNDIPDDFLSRRLSYSIQICINIVRQVRYLNSYGFFISDYNLCNFAERDSDRNIQMWDTDSFGFGSFFSHIYSGEETAAEYDVSTKLGAINFCEESLYLFLFKLLTLGDVAISEFSGKFKYDNPNCKTANRKEFVPHNVYSLLEKTFRIEQEPSTGTILFELLFALNDLQSNPTSDNTFKKIVFNVDDKEQKKPIAPIPEKKPIWEQTWFAVGVGIVIGVLLYLVLSN